MNNELRITGYGAWNTNCGVEVDFWGILLYSNNNICYIITNNQFTIYI